MNSDRLMKADKTRKGAKDRYMRKAEKEEEKKIRGHAKKMERIVTGTNEHSN